MRAVLLRSRSLGGRPSLRMGFYWRQRGQMVALGQVDLGRLLATQPETRQREEDKADGKAPDTALQATGVAAPKKTKKSSGGKSESGSSAPASLTGILGKSVARFLWRLPWLVVKGSYDVVAWTLTMLWHPRKLEELIVWSWQHLKEGAHHYWVGSKLLWRDIVTASGIVKRMLGGSRLSRRERRQLLRTVTDIFRLVPLSFFVIVPFMEFLLPVALKLFPNMLPSTFQDNLKKEEDMRRELKSRLALAGFFADALEEMAKKRKKVEADAADEHASAATQVTKFVERARYGAHYDAEEIVRVSRLFQDELTMDNLPRTQLVSLCQYMGLRPYGSDAFLRWQLRTKLNSIRDDDQRILWEGVESLTKEELREASQERGMRSHGLLRQGYERQLRNWLELSMHRSVPISLLIMSRAFALENQDQVPETLIGETIGSLDETVLNEVLISAASDAESNTSEMRQRKLEALAVQDQLIAKERVDRQREMELRDSDPGIAAAIEGGDARERNAQRALTAGSPDSAPAPAAPADDMGLRFGPPRDMEAEIVVAKQPGEKAAVDATPEAPPSPAAAPESGDMAAEDLEIVKEEIEKQDIKLKPEDVEALAALTRVDALEQERGLLETLRANLDRMDPEATQPLKVDPESGRVQLQERPSEASASQEVPPPEAAAAPSEPEPKDKAAEDIAAYDRKLGTKTDGAVLEAEVVEPAGAAGAGAAGSAAPEAGGAQTAQVVGESGDTVTEDAAVEEDAGEDPVEEVDEVVSVMKDRLSKMLGRLEGRMEQVETSIGEKLHLLDKDEDGLLSTEELKDVVQHVLKNYNSEEDAQRIVQELDEDQDGVVSVQSLYELTQRHKEAQKMGQDDDDDTTVKKDIKDKDTDGSTSGGSDAVTGKATSGSATKSSTGKSGK